ncbi:exocyst complex component EXO70H1-like [Humulus lupulus]|uniref:exocyst complex component EXO70H1-like n=1 Tax=Humulus lupulus TaxID=3486 RepID=UPI002B41174F|nr:exocyst complex component EXO70H1-like [Humulus lupulus]
MPRKGMRSICFNPKTPSLSISRYGTTTTASSSPSSQRTTPASTPTRRQSLFPDSMMDQIVESAAVLILKWDPESSSYAKVTSLFYESKVEAQQFIHCVNDLQKAMHFLVTEDSSSEKLILCQSLMQVAMKRLQKEFYQILSMNRAYLDPESVSTRSSRASARSSTSDYDEDGGATTDDEIRVASDSISDVEQVSSVAMDELKSIAECMISAGYAKECISIYKIIRKSIIDEGIYRMGVEKLSSSQINKTDWEVLELRIKNWLEAVKVSMRTLFNGERILCDHVFAASDSIRESCFLDISKEGALLLFGFPELVAKSKRTPEKMFRILDMYNSIFENWPEIEAIFSFESTAVVRTQAFNSLVKLAEFVRAVLSDFEASIQKDSSKSAPAQGASVHRLTIYVMNYLSLLADYSNVLIDIFRDWPPPMNFSLPESFFDSSDSEDSQVPAMSLRVAWLILVLLCKLDGKAKQYDDVSLSYLFLANNLQHIITKVRTSNLQYLLGDEWTAKHETKVKQFAASYERLGWGHVIAAIPEISNPTAVMTPEEAKTVFRNFNASFEEAYRKQRASVVPNQKLRDEIKVSLARKVVSNYREFYETHRLRVGNGEREIKSYVKYTPEDVGNYISDLFFGMTESESSSASSSPSSSPRWRHWRIR